MSDVDASVVMPAFNEADNIGAQLTALADQVDAPSFEVLVVDNGSTDRTTDVVREFADAVPGLRVIPASEKRGPSFARNVGIKEARSNLILLCDADDRVDRGWVRALVDGLGDADAIAGRTILSENDRPMAWAESDERLRMGEFELLPAFATCNAALRRDAWQEVGGFDETLPPATKEDIDLCWRLQIAGFKVVNDDRAIVLKGFRPAGSAVFSQQYRYGLGDVQMFVKYRSLGLPRSSTRRAFKVWLVLVVRSYRAMRGGEQRRQWCWSAGRRLGRLVGSFRMKALFL